MPGIKGINSIIFIADSAPDEDFALKRTMEIAKSWNARVMVMDVIELSTLEGDVLRSEYPQLKLQEKLLKAREEEIRNIIRPYTDQGTEIKIKVSTGRYHHAVIHAITRGGHKLLIKAPKGPKQEPGAIGPMDRRIISRAPCPVLLLRDIQATAILAAVALDQRHDPTLKSDDMLVRFASAVAEIRQVPLHLVHAWDLPDEKILRAVSSASESEHLKQKIEKAHQELLNKLLQRHPDTTATTHLVEGWASHIVPRLVKELNISLLVIGASQKEKSDYCRLGSISEVILQQVECSALIIKP